MDDPEKALRVRKEQREALTAAVACHLEGEAWAECRMSTKAVMPTIGHLRRSCSGSVKCGWLGQVWLGKDFERTAARHHREPLAENGDGGLQWDHAGG